MRDINYIDVYTINRIPSGQRIGLNDPVPEGRYLLTTRLCLFNKWGEMLVRKVEVQKKKKYEEKWDISIRENVQSGESSSDAVKRALKEQYGIEMDMSSVRPFFTLNTKDKFEDFYIVNYDAEISDLSVDDASNFDWMKKSEIKRMMMEGQFIMIDEQILDYIFDLRRRM